MFFDRLLLSERRLSLSLRACVLVAGCSAGCDQGTPPDEPPSNNGGTDGTGLPSMFGNPTQSGEGSSSDRWHKAQVTRDGVNYFFMANGWGPGFQSQSVSWLGTSFTVESMQGQQGAGYEPASYPTMFCGAYSDSQSGACGLPRAVAEISSLRTGWRWAPNGNNGEYNVAYDVWLANGPTVGSHSAFLMIWLRDPPGQQPGGSRVASGVTVPNAPGTWNVWSGNGGGKPLVSYVRSEGRDSLVLEVDVMDFMRDAEERQLRLPGTHVISVAVGFEIWNGPITNLESQDFYVAVE